METTKVSKRVIGVTVLGIMALALIAGAILSYNTIVNANGSEPITVNTDTVNLDGWMPGDIKTATVNIDNAGANPYNINLIVTEITNDNGVEYTVTTANPYTITPGTNDYTFDFSTLSNSTIGNVNFTIGYERL